MKYQFRTNLLITAGILLLAVALVLASPAQAITWGFPDETNIYSNVGAIVVDLTDRDPLQFCSGTLIAPTIFLTAGHCTDYLVNVLIAGGRLTLETTLVSFDKDDVTNPETWIAVEEIVTHPLYGIKEANDDHDVGLLVLAEAVDLPLANLPPEGFLDQLYEAGLLNDGKWRETFTVVGYGDAIAFSPSEYPPEIVDDGNGRWYGESAYQGLQDAWLLMTQNYLKDMQGTCYGDSGGPAFYTDADGKLWLVGITSWGDMNCIATGFDYRVDIATTLDFVDDYLKPNLQRP